MKLYLVSRTDNYDYDEVVSFVCSAENENQARHTNPYSSGHFNKDGLYVAEDVPVDAYIWGWADDYDSLEVREIGIANTNERLIYCVDCLEG